MKDRKTLATLIGAATSASGVLMIVSLAPQYIYDFAVLAQAPSSHSRFTVGCCFILAGILLILTNVRR